MPYYVPLGVRGLILRVGAVLTGLCGSAIYWRGARRRAWAAGPHRAVAGRRRAGRPTAAG